jgi:hypothetical protein
VFAILASPNYLRLVTGPTGYTLDILERQGLLGLREAVLLASTAGVTAVAVLNLTHMGHHAQRKWCALSTHSPCRYPYPTPSGLVPARTKGRANDGEGLSGLGSGAPGWDSRETTQGDG